MSLSILRSSPERFGKIEATAPGRARFFVCPGGRWPALRGFGEQRAQLMEVERLREIFIEAREQSEFLLPGPLVSGQGDRLFPRLTLLCCGDQLEPASIGQPNVTDQDVKTQIAQQEQGVPARSPRSRLHGRNESIDSKEPHDCLHDPRPTEYSHS